MTNEQQQPMDSGSVDNGSVSPDNRRSSGRLKVQGARSSHGTVLDASAGGLRIRGSLPRGSKPGTTIELAILDAAGQPALPLVCEIRWIQKHPFRGSTFGVAFVHLDEASQRKLFQILREGTAESRCSWRLAS
ncbi:MAG: PilZ domain-containing protein [Planctomycetota bacterium]